MGALGLVNYKFCIVDYNGVAVPSGLSVTITGSTGVALTIYKADKSTSLTNPILSAAMDEVAVADFWYASGGVYAEIDDGANITRYGPIYEYDHRVVVPYLAIAGGITEARTITGEDHFQDYAYTSTCSSGDSAVGFNIKLTEAGTAAAWVAGLFVNVTQASKCVNGYLCAAELELNSTAANASDNSVLVLNSWRNHTGSAPACDPYITLREYGTTYANAFVRIQGDTGQTGTLSATTLYTTVANGYEANCDGGIRSMQGSTPIWILTSTTAPS